MPRKRGAPLGNQNARKHGFYSRVLTATDKHYLKRAHNQEGLDAEIALLRIKIRAVVLHDPENARLIFQGITTLAHLIRTRHYIDPGHDSKDSLAESIEKIIREIGIPLGLDKPLAGKSKPE